jgi:hypothetical protein
MHEGDEKCCEVWKDSPERTLVCSVLQPRIVSKQGSVAHSVLFNLLLLLISRCVFPLFTQVQVCRL